MDTGLTTIPEASTRSIAQRRRASSPASSCWRTRRANPARHWPAPNRRFVSTVSVGSVRRTREVELSKTVGAVHPTTSCSPSRSTRFCFAPGAARRSRSPYRMSLPRAPTSKACRRKTPAPARRRRSLGLQETPVGLGLHLGFQPRFLSVPADRQRRRGAQRHP